MASTWVNRAAPADAKDIAVRILKTFISGALSGATVASFSSVEGVHAAAFAGGTAVFSFVQNALLKFANSR